MIPYALPTQTSIIQMLSFNDSLFRIIPSHVLDTVCKQASKFKAAIISSSYADRNSHQKTVYGSSFLSPPLPSLSPPYTDRFYHSQPYTDFLFFALSILFSSLYGSKQSFSTIYGFDSLSFPSSPLFLLSLWIPIRILISFPSSPMQPKTQQIIPYIFIIFQVISLSYPLICAIKKMSTISD